MITGFPIQSTSQQFSGIVDQLNDGYSYKFVGTFKVNGFLSAELTKISGYTSLSDYITTGDLTIRTGMHLFYKWSHSSQSTSTSLIIFITDTLEPSSGADEIGSYTYYSNSDTHMDFVGSFTAKSN